MLATLFANQLGAVDILVAGALFSSEAVADYAVASRIAALYAFFQLALLKRFSPRAGYLQETGDLVALRHEVELCRRLVIGCTVFTMCGIFVLAPYLLPVFGNYRGAEVLLIWLAIPTFVQSFYATSDRLLISAGQANVAVVLTGLSFTVLTTTPFVTAAWIGMLAIPAAMVVSSIAFQPIVAARVHTLFDIRTIGLMDAAMIAGGALAIAGHAVTRTHLSAAAACAVLAAIGLVYLVPVIRRTYAPAEAAAVR